MKLLANAHISRLIFDFLVHEGNDCVHAELVKPGMPDPQLLEMSVREQRIILTADKDFGELVFQRMLPAVGVVLLRLRAVTESDRLALFVGHWPRVRPVMHGHFVVVTNRRVRRTPLPQGM